MTTPRLLELILAVIVLAGSYLAWSSAQQTSPQMGCDAPVIANHDAPPPPDMEEITHRAVQIETQVRQLSKEKQVQPHKGTSP